MIADGPPFRGAIMGDRDDHVRDALVTLLTHTTPRLLAAVGTLLDFVGSRAPAKRTRNYL